MRAQSDARAALAVGLLAAVVFVVLAVLVMTPFGSRSMALYSGASNKRLHHPSSPQWDS